MKINVLIQGCAAEIALEEVKGGLLYRPHSCPPLGSFMNARRAWIPRDFHGRETTLTFPHADATAATYEL